MTNFNPSAEVERIVKLYQKYNPKIQLQKVLSIGVSGGIDSAVVLALLVRALELGK